MQPTIPGSAPEASGPGRSGGAGRQAVGGGGERATRGNALRSSPTAQAHPVPEDQEAPEPSVPPEVSETPHNTCKDNPQAGLVVGVSEAVRQKGEGVAITARTGPMASIPGDSCGETWARPLSPATTPTFALLPGWLCNEGLSMLHGRFWSSVHLTSCLSPLPPPLPLASGLALWTWPHGKPSTVHSPKRRVPGEQSSLQRSYVWVQAWAPQKKAASLRPRDRTAWGLVSSKSSLSPPGAIHEV